MTSVNKVNPIYTAQNVQDYLKDISKDGRINQEEKTQLDNYIQGSNLPNKDKKLISDFLNKISASTTEIKESHFLWSTTSKELTRPLTPENIKELQTIAAKNPLANSLLNFVKSSQPQQADVSDAKVRNSASFSPSGVNFGAKPAQAQSTSGTTVSSKYADIRSSAYALNQYSTNFNSKGGDCGPTSALMVLRASGFNVDMNDIPRLRKEAGARSADAPKGPYAIDFSQMSKMVAKESGGSIKSEGVKSFNSNPQGRDQLVAHLREELKAGKMPVLVTGVTPLEYLPESILKEHPDYKAKGGHYTVVVGVNDDGSIKVADPAAGGVHDYSADELLARMKIRNAQVMSFVKN